MPDITSVLSEKYKGMEWSLNGSPTNEAEFTAGFTIRKANGVTEPTWSAIQTYLTTMQAEYDALAYARSRKEEYDQLNQFELISDDSINGTTTHKDAILAIKAKYPKE
jgi:hypothetical protein